MLPAVLATVESKWLRRRSSRGAVWSTGVLRWPSSTLIVSVACSAAKRSQPRWWRHLYRSDVAAVASPWPCLWLRCACPCVLACVLVCVLQRVLMPIWLDIACGVWRCRACACVLGITCVACVGMLEPGWLDVAAACLARVRVSASMGLGGGLSSERLTMRCLAVLGGGAVARCCLVVEATSLE